MSLSKTLKKICSSHMVLLTVAVAAVLIYYLNYYSAHKGLITDTMATGGMNQQAMKALERPNPGNILNPPYPPSQVQTNRAGGDFASCCNQQGPAQPSSPLGQNEHPSSVTGLQTNMHGLPPSCTRQQVANPAQLLPRDNNNEFSKMNPMGAGDVANVSLLKAGYHIGINTVGQSLRNANLQLRSEPANPQLKVGPWNTSTIGPDFNRRPLEIGCGPF